MPMRRPYPLLILAVISGACDGTPAVQPPLGISVEHLATSKPIPFSESELFAVLGDDRVCALDSYEVRIVCGDRGWNSTVMLGRKGNGPGEIQVPGPLLTMPDGGLAYVDLKNDRLTLYSPDLQFSRHVRMDVAGSVVPPVSRDSLLLIGDNGRRGAGRQLHVYDLAADSLIDSLPFVIDPKALNLDSVMASPIQRTSDRMILRATGERLIWMTTDGSTILGQIPPPDFDPGYPDSVDLEEIRADLKSIFGVVLDRDIKRLRERRKLHYSRENSAQFDTQGRLWLLTNRPSQKSETLFDIYRDTTFLGSLPVAGRVLAFRLRDSLLVTMIRSVGNDATGIHHRRFSWYRIRSGGP